MFIALRENPHISYIPNITLLYKRKHELRGTQNEVLFSSSSLQSKKNMSYIIKTLIRIRSLFTQIITEKKVFL